MERQLSIDTLRKIATASAALVKGNSVQPIYDHVLIEDERVVLGSATIQLEWFLGEEEHSFGFASQAYPARDLERIAKSLPDGAQVEFGEQGKIRCGRSRFRLPVYDGVQYPVKAEPLPSSWVSVQTQDLERIFPSLRRCVAKNDTRTYLNGIHWQIRRVGEQESVLVLEATDGHRAARFSLEYTPPLDSANDDSAASQDPLRGAAQRGASSRPQDPQGALQAAGRTPQGMDAILPVDGLSAWMKLLSSRKIAKFSLAQTRSGVLFQGGGLRLWLTSLDGRYPSLDTILAQMEKRKDVLTLSIADFQRALTLATIGVGDSQAVTLSTAPEHLLSVAAKGEERQAEDQIPAQWSGSLPLRYSFNIQYLMDVVDSVKETTKGSEDTEDPHMALRFDVSEKDPTSTFAEVPGGVLVVMPIRE
ncbi:DNA polymerase III subunit beta [Acidithiobacillus caldus]|uniref:DNA polymerase III subunit beta n=1 Tax=Acidithiobacillus caldus TaxID=33059 RepID=UPI001C066E35|nr:DNA polymerase III subunit beta [Acidithiobacillus caldus]MBU2783835.1 DNA polymerase III subunit beta [Acidithiobacillus caldus]